MVSDFVNVTVFNIDSTWTKNKVVWRSFMGSDMTNNPPSWDRGIFNVSVLFGCGVSSKREVGMVSSAEFNKTFYPHIREALSKYQCTIELFMYFCLSICNVSLVCTCIYHNSY